MNPRSLESSNLKVVAIIPARFGSTRFPGKPLIDIMGKPMIQHVWERVKKAREVEKVIIATDDERVYNAVKGFGGEAVLTSKDHPSGTDRIAEVVKCLPSGTDIIVNIQVDEPLIEPEMVDQVVRILKDDSKASIGTLCRRIEDVKEIVDPNIVKVVFDKEKFALYFSRLPIPYQRDKWKVRSQEPRAKGIDFKGIFALRTPNSKLQTFHCYKHLGIYSYRRDALLSLSSMRQTALEKAEQLEQLRALESGIRIKVGKTRRDTIGVDTKEDLQRVIKRIKHG